MLPRQARQRIAGCAWLAASLFGATCIAAPEYSRDVAPILAKYCTGCHNAADLEGDLSLESFADLQKGGSRGPAIVPGNASESLLVRALEGSAEPAMPPEDSERPTADELATLRAWIDAGAKGPESSEANSAEPITPKIAAAANVREMVTSMAIAPDGKRLALGRYRHVDLVDPTTKQVLATSPELPGKINAISFSKDGKQVVAASGIPGLYGVAAICNAVDGTVIAEMKGHRDALYDARLSPDGKLLATCSYDRVINLWDVATGKVVRTLSGHNGAVFELAFSSDGAVLATASADDTVKVWNVATGERLDTLGQPEGSQAAVAISPDDEWLVAGGADGKLRMWRLLSRDKPQINPLKYSQTAHDSPIVEVAFAPDGKTIVTASESRELLLWDVDGLIPIHNYETQPDVVTGISFDPAATAFYVARMDGSWDRYDVVRDATSQVAADEPSREAETAAAPAPAVSDVPRFDGTEQEPNNNVATANEITANALVRGVIRAEESGLGEADLFRFKARKGEQIVVETKAARQKSPLDSRLEVLDAAGEPVPRVLLQAVRETYFTFRGHDSTDLNDYRLHGWEDMELNEYLYSNGEVNKLWLYPRGPDSGFIVYPGISGSRYAYFGTSALAHAVNEPCYIVEAHPPGAKLIPNGLPQYSVYYDNDDDGWRKLGNDSRILFTAPADGEYLIRVTDVRDLGGDDYKYKLIVRPARPDFKVQLDASDLTINAGSGKEFSIVADRMDDFDGEIRVDITDLPPGFHASTPITIQSGQKTAYGVITADADAPPPMAENSKVAKLTATAQIAGKDVTKDAISLGELKLAEKPKILVRVVPDTASGKTVAAAKSKPNDLTELFIAPGEMISAIVEVERNGFDGEIKFGGDYSGRNLPHGVYVDNIGLNGLTVLQGDSRRQFFITAAKWVPETTRMFHLVANVEGNQTSWPVLLHVRKPGNNRATADASAGE